MTRILPSVIFQRDVMDRGTHLYPFTKASPAVGLMSPVSILKVVVLPAPLIPSKPKHCKTQRHTQSFSLNVIIHKDLMKRRQLLITTDDGRWYQGKGTSLVTDHFIHIFCLCCQISAEYIC